MIEETEERIASVDQMHLDAESVESTGIFRTDHARPHNRESFWERADLENFVRVMHARMLERKLGRTHW